MSVAREPRSWQWQTLEGFPVVVHIESASPHEVKLVEETIDSGFTEYVPDKLIGDKVYDSDELDQRLLNDRNIEMVASHRKGCKRPKNLRRTKLEAISTPMEGGAAFCLASEFQTTCSSIRISR